MLHNKRAAWNDYLPLGANAQTFVDETFNDGDWTTDVFATPSPSSTPMFSTDQQVATGGVGNPDPYRKIDQTLGGPVKAKVMSIHLNTNATWNPGTDGPIAFVDYSEDARAVNTDPGTFGASVSFALKQNNVIYIAGIGTTRLIGETGKGTRASPWRTLERQGLIEGNFVEIETTLTLGGSFTKAGSNPDFSSSGMPIQFGYARLNSHTNTVFHHRITGIDNWKVTVHQPVFTHAITSVFPDEEFLTCQVGHFDRPQAASSVPHSWYVRPRQDGQLTVTVAASTVNPSEVGSITGVLFDGLSVEGSKNAIHPSGPTADPGDEKAETFSAGVVAGKIYRLRITRQTNPVPEAHHYKLGFDLNGGREFLDVGIATPTFRYFEHHTQYFHLNLDVNEDNVELAILVDTDASAGQATELTVLVFDSGETLIHSDSVTMPLPPPPPPSPQPLPPNGVLTSHVVFPNPYRDGAGDPLPGTVTVRIEADGHYRLGKHTGSDSVVYMDSCEPPPAPPEPRTIGYWKNHPDETEALLTGSFPTLVLGEWEVATLAEADDVFANANGRNAHNMLAAQLLATKLNLRNGVDGSCVVVFTPGSPPTGAVPDANKELRDAENLDDPAEVGYRGPNSTVAPQKGDKSAVNQLKDALDDFNNDGCS